MFTIDETPKDIYLVHASAFKNETQLNAFFSRFGINLPLLPKFPITIPDAIEFAKAAYSDLGALEKCIDHVKRNYNIFWAEDAENPKAQAWPKTPSSLGEELFWGKTRKIIDKKTKIVSLGSCFAVEIADWLQSNNYNYVVTERTPGFETEQSSARWGMLFSAPTIKQAISWAFGEDFPPMALYVRHDKSNHAGAIGDLFRDTAYYVPDYIDHAPGIWRTHLACSRKALEQCEVLIITVGLIEVFRWLPTGHYLHTSPNPGFVNPALFEAVILTVAQNVAYITEAVTILRRYNPGVKIIASVSPVPLSRTFRRDTHVVVATAHAKAVLRVAMEELCNSIPDFHYMPSFETVMYPGKTLDPWLDDERHVNREAVAKIMSLFEKQFCSDDEA